MINNNHCLTIKSLQWLTINNYVEWLIISKINSIIIVSIVKPNGNNFIVSIFLEDWFSKFHTYILTKHLQFNQNISKWNEIETL